MKKDEALKLIKENTAKVMSMDGESTNLFIDDYYNRLLDVWDLAIEKAAEVATANYEAEVDKNSILNLKIK